MPGQLQVRAFHRGSAFGGRAVELILRSSDGELLFAYRYANGLGSALDPPWIESLDPVFLEPIASPCNEEIEYPCALCTSEALAVSAEGDAATLLHGGDVSIGSWTLQATRLVTCEQLCEPGYYPNTVIAIVHASVAN